MSEDVRAIEGMQSKEEVHQYIMEEIFHQCNGSIQHINFTNGL